MNSITTATPPPTNGVPINGKPLPLFPAHLAELRASGLSDDTIRAAGIYSESDRRKLASLMNNKNWSAKRGSAIVYPYHDESGAVVLNRVKPDLAPQIKGKSAKYLSPSGAPVRVYFPPGTHRQIADGAVEILITEGEKKSLAATQAGFCCIGLSGVDCWHRKKSTALLPDLDNVQLVGRTVHIVFDSDAANNSRIRENESQLATALQRQGAVVKVVRLPAGLDGAKVGLDDYLIAHGPGELRMLLDHAEPPEMPEPDIFMTPAGEADGADVAQRMLASLEWQGVTRLRYWRGEWWYWDNGGYRQLNDEDLRGKVVEFLCRDYFKVKCEHVSNVIEHLKSQALVPARADAPMWLSPQSIDWPAPECLATKSGVVHLSSLVSQSEPSIVPATPALFTLTATDLDLDKNAPRPATWFKFLAALWGDDQQSIDTLQEIFGYLLTTDTRQQKIFLLIGPKRSGKGTIARLLTGIIGKANVAAPSLAGLATNFGLWPLIGKTAAIIPDARLSGRADQAAVVERLLSISGECAPRACTANSSIRLYNRRR